MKILSPSILSADFGNLASDIKRAVDAGAQWLHFDVMDGMYVPQISFGSPVLKAVRPITDVCIDVHLMIEDPGRYVEEYAALGADVITVHAEACTHLDRVIQQIKACGKKPAVALNPGTPLSVLDYVLDDLYMVLVMTVNPGFGGQSYVPYCSKKIAQLKAIIQERKLDTLIQVDGGINVKTIEEASESGADVLVAGSAVFGDQAHIEENVKRLLEKIN